MNDEKRNLLTIHNPALLPFLTPLPDDITVTTTRSGVPTVCYHTSAGKKYIHSHYDPITEAQKLLNTITVKNNHYLIIFGNGLGYAAYEALHRGFKRIIIVENNSSLITAWLNTASLAEIKMILEKTQFIYTHTPHHTAQTLINAVNINTSPVIDVLELRPVCDINTHYWNTLRTAFNTVLQHAINQRATTRHLALLWIINTVRTLPHTLQCTFSLPKYPHPVIIISAGPSLDQYRTLLPSLAAHALLMCVDTACPILADMNITPDIIISIDPQPISHAHFVNHYYSAAYIRSIFSHPAVVQHFAPEQTFCFIGYHPLESPFIDIGGCTPAHTGGSVTTAAVQAARIMQASHIILLGTDLCYQRMHPYAHGTYIEQQYHRQTQRMRSLESLTRSFIKKRARRNRDGYMTGSSMHMSQQWLDNAVHNYTGRALRVGDGLPLQNWQSCTPEEIITILGTHTKPPIRFTGTPIHNKKRIQTRIAALLHNAISAPFTDDIHHPLYDIISALPGTADYHNTILKKMLRILSDEE